MRRRSRLEPCPRRDRTHAGGMRSAPMDSRVSPIAAAIPIGAHSSPISTPATPASSRAPIIRHWIGDTPRWSRIARDLATPSSLMLAAKVKSAASNSVTTTVAVSTTADYDRWHARSKKCLGQQESRMIRCVRLWTGQDGDSHFRDGRLDITPGRNNDLVSTAMAATHATVEETAGGGPPVPVISGGSKAPIRGGACMWCSHPTPRFRSSGTESLGDPRLYGCDERLHGRQPGIGLRREHDVPGRKGLESRTGYR